MKPLLQPGEVYFDTWPLLLYPRAVEGATVQSNQRLLLRCEVRRHLRVGAMKGLPNGH